jgi:hypothetical protein
MEVALALGATGEPQSLVRLHEAGQPSLDVRELIEESEFLRSAVEAVRHHSNYFPPDHYEILHLTARQPLPEACN